jgi:hypothetical protein
MSNTIETTAALQAGCRHCEAAELLKAAGFAGQVPPRRRKSDPGPADGFRAFGEQDGTVLVCWVPAGGGDHKKPGQLAKSLEMAGRYADTARAAGWTAEIGGIIWHHARLAKAES